MLQINIIDEIKLWRISFKQKCLILDATLEEEFKSQH